MKFKKAGLIIASILLLILAFFNRKDIVLTKQDDMKVHAISETGDEMTTVIHLYNPNLLSSTIKTVKEKFYVNGVLLSTFDMELNQGIAGMKDSEFPISVRFSKADYARAIHLDSTSASIALHVDGEIVFQNLISGGKIKIQQSQPVYVRES